MIDQIPLDTRWNTPCSYADGGAEHISKGNLNLSQRTEEQASSLGRHSTRARAGEQGRGVEVVADDT